MEPKRSWWQQIKRPLSVIGIIAVLVVAIVLIFVEVRVYGTGFTGKTLWDWLQLLIIPAVLAVGGYVINLTISRSEQDATRQRDKTEREIALDNQRESALQEYINKISDLLLHEKSCEPRKDDELRKIARVRTLTTISSLNDIRKGVLIQFLWESDLINNGIDSIIYLYGADLSGANLSSAVLDGCYLGAVNLSGANLSGAFLIGAILIGVNLSEANLHNADLTSAQFGRAMQEIPRLHGAKRTVIQYTNLCKADLSGANLSEADLSEADLSDTNFEKANLRGAIVTDEQLTKAKSLKGATMPDGSIHP